MLIVQSPAAKARPYTPNTYTKLASSSPLAPGTLVHLAGRGLEKGSGVLQDIIHRRFWVQCLGFIEVLRAQFSSLKRKCWLF